MSHIFSLPSLPGTKIGFQCYRVVFVLVTYFMMFNLGKLPIRCLRTFVYHANQAYPVQILVTNVTTYIFCLPSLPKFLAILLFGFYTSYLNPFIFVF